GEIQRIVPRRDDADDAEWLAQDAGASRQAPPGDGTPLGTHPAAQVTACMGNAFEAREDLEQLRFLAGAESEIRGNGISNRGGVLPQQPLETHEAIPPDVEGWRRVRCERLAL